MFIPIAHALTSASVTDVNSLNAFITRIANTFGGIVIAVSAVFIAWAGLYYVTAKGDEKKVGAAKNMLMYGLVGVAVAALATVLPIIVQSIVQAY
jgi:hypothetical protein